MNFAPLIAQYGYVALFIGCLFEGETVLILAGFAAYQGYLQLPWVMVVAMVGGFLGDQIYFWLGRRHGAWVLSHFPRLIPLFDRAAALIELYHEFLIVSVRFVYGLRTVGPMALGMSVVSAGRFMVFNALGAAIWAVGIAGAGYFFGHALALFFADLRKLEVVVLVIIVCAGFAMWLRSRYKIRHQSK